MTIGIAGIGGILGGLLRPANPAPSWSSWHGICHRMTGDPGKHLFGAPGYRRMPTYNECLVWNRSVSSVHFY